MSLNWNFLNLNRQNQTLLTPTHRIRCRHSLNRQSLNLRCQNPSRCQNPNQIHYRSLILNRFPNHCRYPIQNPNQIRYHCLNRCRYHFHCRSQTLTRYQNLIPIHFPSCCHFPIPTQNPSLTRYPTLIHFHCLTPNPSLNLSCWNCWILHRDSADTDRRFCCRFCRYTDSIQSENHRVCRPSTANICHNTGSNLWRRPHRTDSSKPHSASKRCRWCLRSSESQ